MICLLAFPALVHAKTYAFGEQVLYREPYVSPRSPDTGITINTSRYHEERIGYIEASVGKNIPIATWSGPELPEWGQLKLQIGIASGFWVTLGYDKGYFPLLTQDFLISVPVEFALGQLSGALKFSHISAHLGDGFDGLLEDKLSGSEQEQLDQAEELVGDATGHKDAGITLIEPFNYSRDFLSAHIAYDDTLGIFAQRTYAHAGYAHKLTPRKIGRWFIGTGLELTYKGSTFSPYYAQDVTYNQDVDSLDFSGELGTILFSGETGVYNIRAAFTTFIGKDRRGQLMNRKMRQIGLGVFVD